MLEETLRRTCNIEATGRHIQFCSTFEATAYNMQVGDQVC